MRKKLTTAVVAKARAEPGKDRTVIWDTTLPGFGLVITASGHKSFVAQYRANGRSRRYTINSVLSVTDARKEARGVLAEAAKGKDPLAARQKAAGEATNTLRAIAEEYFNREIRLRTIDDRRSTFERLIFPKFGSRQIDTIRRTEIVRLLDVIEDENGPVMADQALAYLRRFFTWHAGRSDEFRSPIVRGMARTKPKERRRKRILSDEELRAVWKAAEAADGPFGHLVRFILLTATRRNEAARMKRSEVSGDEWTIPTARYKSKLDFLLPLSPAASTLLASVPAIGGKYVFTTDGKRPIGGFSKAKREFDAKVLAVLREQDPEAKPLPNWTIHDLRRTARSLMSRCGVDPDHAERCLGHVIAGVRGTYDRHEYRDEKAAGFQALAAQIERIINPQDNVVHLVPRASTS